jgi:3-hydroxyacyl-CoA dehydrogenase / enoyl-CoA hydratase / 3-hydroxybutyryl-CoA epimerase
MSSPSLRLVKRPDGVGVVVFDVPGEVVNTLRGEFADELDGLLDGVERDPSIVAIVLASAKRDSFIAGADISMLAGVSSPDAAAVLSNMGQRAVDRIEKLKVPTVAAIHGACLGGGLELALGCGVRIATAHAKTKLGLPEVQLGILPGMGGTQRLPRLIGLSSSLDLLLTGRQLDAHRAKKMGLVDEVVPEAILMHVAVGRALQLAKQEGEKEKVFGALRELLDPEVLKELALAENPIGRKVVFDQARKKLLEKTQGNYPAPERILEVVRLGLERGLKAGLSAEADAFGALVVSKEAGALRHVYFSQQALKKQGEVDVERSAQKVGVLGAGLMGAGVSFVSVYHADTTVRLKDVTEAGVARGLQGIERLFDVELGRRRITPREKARYLAKVTRTTDAATLGKQDVIIEAVFEDLELKKRVLSEVEALGSDTTIFASNTSSLPIKDIAEEAKRPELVIGMHYFSPVEKMPLLEIITTPRTAPWVVDVCVDLGRRQGKTVIVVGDGPGFYTTRILGPYLNEAAFGLLEGMSVETVDAALVAAGFPVGPLALLDEVGIDVGTKVVKTLVEAFGSRVAPPPQLAQLLAAGRLGRKNKKGFYDYKGKHSGKRPVDESVYVDLGLSVPKGKAARPAGLEAPGSIAERCLLAMVNEAAHCLGEGILKGPRDGDIGAIFGLGFPPFLGGPFYFVDIQGAADIVGRLRRLEQQFGERFTPAPRLVEAADKQRKFY